MNVNDFSFVHYILITIIFSHVARTSVKPTHGKRNKGNGIDQENMATNRFLEQEK